MDSVYVQLMPCKLLLLPVTTQVDLAPQQLPSMEISIGSPEVPLGSSPSKDQILFNIGRCPHEASYARQLVPSPEVEIRILRSSTHPTKSVVRVSLAKAKPKTENEKGNLLILSLKRPQMILLRGPSNVASKQSTTSTEGVAGFEDLPPDHADTSESRRDRYDNMNNGEGKTLGEKDGDFRSGQPRTSIIVASVSLSGSNKQAASHTQASPEAQQTSSDSSKSNNGAEKSKDEGKGKGKGKAPDDKKEDEEDNLPNSNEELPFDAGEEKPKCHICGDVMVNPVTIRPCNHRVDRDCWQWWSVDRHRNRRRGAEPVLIRCPKCGVHGVHLDD